MQNCQFVTVECRNPGCGQQVLLSEAEDHLKYKCHSRTVECEDCGKRMCYRDLKVCIYVAKHIITYIRS